MASFVGFAVGATAHGVGASCFILVAWFGVLARGAGVVVGDAIAVGPTVVVIGNVFATVVLAKGSYFLSEFFIFLLHLLVLFEQFG